MRSEPVVQSYWVEMCLVILSECALASCRSWHQDVPQYWARRGQELPPPLLRVIRGTIRGFLRSVSVAQSRALCHIVPLLPLLYPRFPLQPKPKGRGPQNLKIMAKKGGHENLKMGTKRDQKGDLRKLKMGNKRGADWSCGGLTCLISNLPTWGREWGGIKFYPKLVLENQWHLCILVW